MKLRHTTWVAAVCLTLSLAPFSAAAGWQPPKAAAHIPGDAVYAIFVSNPGQALGNLDAILQNFKTISPEIDLKRQGERLKQEIGENFLTPEGLTAFGLDPAGTFVIYGTGIERGPMFALALGKPGLFKERLIALIKKESPKFKDKSIVKAGVEIYEIDRGYIGFKDSWCVVLSPESINPGQKDKQLLEFFKPKRRLSRDPAFVRTVANMPGELHALMFLDLKQLALLGLKQSQDSLQGMIKSYQKSRDRKERKGIIESLKKEAALMGKLRKRAKKELAFIDRLALGWTVKSRSIDSAGFLGVTPAGHKILQKILPPQSQAPGLHAGLMETAVLGGWLSLDLKQLLDKFGWVPLHGEMTLKKSLEQDAQGFKRDTKIDFFNELLGGLAGPGAFYLLQPGQAPANAGLSPEQQLNQMLRVAYVAQVKNPKQAGSVVARLNQFISSRGMPVNTEDVSAASVTTLKPEPGVALSWGLKGDSVFITYGENTAKALAKILPAKAWSKKAKIGPVGSGLLDFAVLAEGISSAMSRGVGGQDAAQFRMMIWPIMQQVLGKLSKIHFSARLVAKGLSTAGSLEFR